MNEIDYRTKYEEEKSRREKIENDYINLKEKADKVNTKIKELETKSKNNSEVYEKACKTNEELKTQLIKALEEKEAYKRGIEKLILTLGK